MARKRNYEQLYKTYQRRRERLYSSGKDIDSQLDYSHFILTYESMYEQYKEQGYKTPTKNIIQNLTNAEIQYDWSFQQAREIKKYFKEQGYDYKIYDIRHGFKTGNFQTAEFNQLLSDTYKKILEQHPEWNTKGKKKEAAAVLKNIFFGDSK